MKYENEFQVEGEQQENPKHREKLETLKESVEKDEDQGPTVQIRAKDEELKRSFTHELHNIWFVATCLGWNPKRNYINLYCQKRPRGLQRGL